MNPIGGMPSISFRSFSFWDISTSIKNNIHHYYEQVKSQLHLDEVTRKIILIVVGFSTFLAAYFPLMVFPILAACFVVYVMNKQQMLEATLNKERIDQLYDEKAEIFPITPPSFEELKAHLKRLYNDPQKWNQYLNSLEHLYPIPFLEENHLLKFLCPLSNCLIVYPVRIGEDYYCAISLIRDFLENGECPVTNKKGEQPTELQIDPEVYQTIRHAILNARDPEAKAVYGELSKALEKAKEKEFCKIL